MSKKKSKNLPTAYLILKDLPDGSDLMFGHVECIEKGVLTFHPREAGEDTPRRISIERIDTLQMATVDEYARLATMGAVVDAEEAGVWH